MYLCILKQKVKIMSNALSYRILAIILLGICLNTSHAQQLRPRAVEAGFCAGPTIGWAAPQTISYESTGAKIGGYYGLNLDVNLIRTKEVLYLSTGIVLKHKRFGLSYEHNFTDSLTMLDVRTRITSNYNPIFFSIPTAIKLKTEPFSDFTIFGVLGLEHGFCIAANMDEEITRLDSTGLEVNIMSSERVVLLQESIFAVLGMEYILFNRTKATFGIAYSYGLNSIFRRKQNNLNGDRVIANIHTIEFQFGFIF